MPYRLRGYDGVLMGGATWRTRLSQVCDLMGSYHVYSISVSSGVGKH